jgi:hypothetical protein
MKKKKKKSSSGGPSALIRTAEKKKNFGGWQYHTAFRNKVSSVETSRVPVGRLTVPGPCMLA